MRYDKNLPKQEKGLTLISVAITVIVVLVLLAISMRYAKEIVTQTQLEELKTDMLFMQASAMKILESAKFEGETQKLIGTSLKLSAESTEIEEENKKMEIRRNSTLAAEEIIKNTNKYATVDELLDNSYYLTPKDIEDLGLKNEVGKSYFLLYNLTDISVEVACIEGFKYANTIYYSLGAINML